MRLKSAAGSALLGSISLCGAQDSQFLRTSSKI